MRKKRLFFNTFSSLLYEFTVIVCGFILPRLILQSFGSEVNGLVNSIMQFLAIIGFLELGVGSVVQSSLYKPLSDKDNKKISEIVVSANKFFKRIAEILLVYIVFLVGVYPFIAHQNFGWVYTAALIAAISISSFAQYYFGVVDRLLLTADQRGYIQYNAQTITLILNTAACAVLISFGASIHIVKLTTSIIYLARPLFLRWYVNKHYALNRKITYKEEPIKQKWNGIAQHIAAVVLDQTDNIVLTVFSTLSNVSIYSVYFLVVNGVKQLFLSMTNGIKALIGELWAKQELENLEKTFGWFEWIMHTGTIYVFGCTSVLIVPFVSVYTNGINDTNYIQPLFAALITAANAVHCLRLPYNVMILAAGHYKQTQISYIVAVILNIVLSIVLVVFYGLIGVAIGTLCAMAYQTIWMAIYNSKNFLKRPFRIFVKQMIVDIISAVLGILATFWICLDTIGYWSWIVMALKVAVIWFIVIIFTNSIFYRSKVKVFLNNVRNKIKK